MWEQATGSTSQLFPTLVSLQDPIKMESENKHLGKGAQIIL